MVSETSTAELVNSRPAEQLVAGRNAAVLFSSVIFSTLLGLVLLTAIPYGTAEPWWKAVFVCLVFAISLLWILEGFLSGSWQPPGWPIFLPVLALVAFSLAQTVSLWQEPLDQPGYPSWNAVSADPYATRFFALQLLALAIAGVLFSRYANSEQRTRKLIHLIVGVAVASAIFGLVRQTTQRQLGFGLPLVRPDQGYGQFINQNHFAFLMEMAFGLIVGMVLGGGVKREKVLIYLAALLPVWSGLVLSNSRGGILAMLGQVTCSALLLSTVIPRLSSQMGDLRLLRIALSRTTRFFLLLLLISAVIVGAVWLGGDRLASKVEQGTTQFSGTSAEMRQNVNRREIWYASWRMFTDYPIAGVGLGGYWAAVPTYHDASGSLTPQEAHNDYLELLASGGVIGAVFGLWFMLVVFKRIQRNLRCEDQFRRTACLGATIGLIGVGIHSLVDFGLHMIVNALVFTALVVIATNAEQEQDCDF